MTRFLARDYLALVELSDEITYLKFDRQTELCVFLVSEGLMRLEYHISFLLWLLKIIKRRDMTSFFFAYFAKRDPYFVKVFLRQTVEHMLVGDDKEDYNSVGGFSQREIDKIVGFLKL